MSTNMAIEVAGHLAAIIAFLSVSVYITVRRRMLRRTVRRSWAIYWLMLLASALFAMANGVRLYYVLTRGSDSLAPWLDLLSEYPSFVGQSLIILALTNLKIAGDAPSSHKRVLAIGAHPDDIEIACGGTLAKMRDAGFEVRGLVLTQGEKGGNPQVRPDEARRGAEFLGLSHVCVLDLPDTRLKDRGLEVLSAIEEVIREYKPNIILTHSSHDLHQDHQAVHDATLRAARDLGMILCYESPSVTQEFMPTFFFDIGDYLDVKVEGIKEHWDQRSKPYVQEERVRGVAIFRGGQAKLRYAEGFEVVRAVSTMMFAEPKPLMSKEQRSLEVVRAVSTAMGEA